MHVADFAAAGGFQEQVGGGGLQLAGDEDPCPESPHHLVLVPLVCSGVFGQARERYVYGGGEGHRCKGDAEMLAHFRCVWTSEGAICVGGGRGIDARVMRSPMRGQWCVFLCELLLVRRQQTTNPA